MRSELVSFGLADAGLPSLIGGGWTYSNFVMWSEFRTRMEWQIPMGQSGGVDAYSFPGIQQYDLLPDHQSAERKRRLSVIHSRRKRDRMLVDADLMRQQISSLEEVNKKLREEHARLDTLFSTAHDLVSQLDS